jgi:hypothetical protein
MRFLDWLLHYAHRRHVNCKRLSKKSISGTNILGCLTVVVTRKGRVNRPVQRHHWRRDTVARIANCYGLEVSGFEYRCNQEMFSSPHPSRSSLWPAQPPVQWVQRLFSRGLSGRGLALNTTIHQAPRLGIIRTLSLLHHCLFVCFPGVTTRFVCIFHSPVAGFSLLGFEVPWPHTTTLHSR